MNDLETRIKRIIAEQLGLEEAAVTDEKTLKEDLNADSLDTIELTMALEDEFGLEIPDEEAENATTVKAVVDLVQSKLKD